jgi:hypothetical protein
LIAKTAKHGEVNERGNARRQHAKAPPRGPARGGAVCHVG